MNANKCIWSLFLFAVTTTSSAESVEVPEHVTLETIHGEIQYNWRIQYQPCLILTDKQCIVTAEGFNINDLDENIKQ